MSYGYIGDTSSSIKQQVKNAGVLSMSDVLDLESKGHLGGSLELIETQTFSGVSQVDFTSIKQNKYNVHFISCTTTDVDNALKVRLGNSGGIISSGYQLANQFMITDGTFGEQKSTSSINFIDSGNSNSDSKNLYMYLYNAGNSSKYTFATSQVFGSHTSTAFIGYFGGAVRPTADEITQIRFYADTDLTGTIKLFGVKQI